MHYPEIILREPGEWEEAGENGSPSQGLGFPGCPGHLGKPPGASPALLAPTFEMKSKSSACLGDRGGRRGKSRSLSSILPQHGSASRARRERLGAQALGEGSQNPAPGDAFCPRAEGLMLNMRGEVRGSPRAAWLCCWKGAPAAGGKVGAGALHAPRRLLQPSRRRTGAPVSPLPLEGGQR